MRRLFGVPWVPQITFGASQFPEEVGKVVEKMSISGVQPKASVALNKKLKRIEVVQEKGTHILKPDTVQLPEIAENESLCMDMAEVLGMDVPPHGVLSLADGTPAYVIQRFDRLPDGGTLHQEDMMQLMQPSTNDKYDASLEQVGKVIKKYATHTFLDLTNFFERIIFNFVIGNSDMHLKNWTLLTTREKILRLAPCYDFVSSALYPGYDREESALTINGKKNRINKPDFDTLAAHLELDSKASNNVFQKVLNAQKKILEMVSRSDISSIRKDTWLKVISSRYERLKESSAGAVVVKLEAVKKSSRKTVPSTPFAKDSSRDKQIAPGADTQLWISNQRSEAMKLLEGHLGRNPGFEQKSPGFMEFTSCIPAGHTETAHEELKRAAEISQIQTFGWPIGIVMNNEPYKPKADTEGVKAVVQVNREDGNTFDYWYLRRNGDYYLLKSLFEDLREKNKIFLDTRIVRVTETMQHTYLLYKNLGVDLKTPVAMQFFHSGLKDRELAVANRARIPSTVRKSGVDVVKTPITIKLEEIDSQIQDLVYKVICDLTVMFDFFKPSKIDVVDPLVTNFLSGKIT